MDHDIVLFFTQKLYSLCLKMFVHVSNVGKTKARWPLTE